MIHILGKNGTIHTHNTSLDAVDPMERMHRIFVYEIIDNLINHLTSLPSDT